MWRLAATLLLALGGFCAGRSWLFVVLQTVGVRDVWSPMSSGVALAVFFVLCFAWLPLPELEWHRRVVRALKWMMFGYPLAVAFVAAISAYVHGPRLAFDADARTWVYFGSFFVAIELLPALAGLGILMPRTNDGAS